MARKMQKRIIAYVFPIFVGLFAIVVPGSADQYFVEDPDSEFSDDAEETHIPNANISPITPNVEEIISIPEGMARAIEEFQIAAQQAKKIAQDGVLPQEEIRKHYAKMAEMLEEILDYMYSAENAYSLLQAKCFDTIIAPNMHINYPLLRSPLLQLIKALFDIVPTTTLSVLPNKILDKLVDIFELDDNIVIKTHAIELLSALLPGNVQAQTRVMKMRGLEPFYRQLSKLEPPLTKITLELFNKILNEHIVARNKKIQKNKEDYRTFLLYQRIGLIERLSTPAMCQGLLNIFQEIFSSDSSDKDLLPPVLKLLQIIKPHCAKALYGDSEVATLINEMSEYVQEPYKRLYLGKLGVNVTEVVESLTDFADKVKLKHTEL